MSQQPHPFHSARLLYRAIEPEADEPFFLQIQQDAFGYRNSNVSLPRPQSKKDAQNFIKSLVEDQLLTVVICLPSTAPDATPIPIGQIHLTAPHKAMAHHRSTDIGIDILPEYQGKGYGSEAIVWITAWAFECAGMHRVGIRCFGWNTGARKLYGRLGFKEEGVVREMLWFQGRWWDDVGFGMLEGEWRERREGKTVVVS